MFVHLNLRSVAVRPHVLLSVIVFSVLTSLSAIYAQTPSTHASLTGTSARDAFLEKQCADCHNDDVRRGGFSTSQLDLAHPEHSAELNEKIIQRLRSGMMPPVSRKRPPAQDVNAFASWLESRQEIGNARNPYVGYVGLHRLNRLEYANSVRDLLGLNIDAASLLPADDLSHGFNNMADALSTSPALLKAYIDAARKVSYDAVGDATAAPVEKTYHIPRIISQSRHIDGTPYGSRGGVALVHTFPADGTYIFKVAFYTHQQGYLYGQNQGKGQQVEVAVNGVRVALFDIDPKWKVGQDLKTPPIFVKAGPQEISASFLKKFDGPVQDEVQPFWQSLIDVNVANLPGLTTLPHLYDLSITGPQKITGISSTPSRERIFTCHPEDGAGQRDIVQNACARKIVTALVRSAYRKPATEQNINLALRYYAQQRSSGRSFDEGIRASLQSILANPQFLYRFERLPVTAKPGQRITISDVELASRLSYFLWSAPPDETLLRLAFSGQLHQPAVLEQQVRRMLRSDKSGSLASSFAVEWLNLNNLKQVLPDPYLYPNFDNNLAQSMLRETELFFSSIVQEDRSVLDLLNADYTFVDEGLARHYGIPNVVGNRFRRVTITDDNRRGLLGQASILTLTSTANRTSPVTRGKWILEVFFGAPPPPPPPNTPSLIEAGDEATPHTVRQRLEEHRKNPSCASCHNRIDAQGFALENFDPTGAWRSLDNGQPVDSTGRLFDGTELSGPASLRKAILSHSQAFLDTFTENLFAYGLGRVPDYRDRPEIRAIVNRAHSQGDRFSALVVGIVESPAFRQRTVPGTLQQNAHPVRTAVEKAIHAPDIATSGEDQ